MRPLPFLILITLLVVQLAMFLVSLFAFGLNQAGHSDFDPLSVTAGFAPIALIALVFLVLKPYAELSVRFKLAVLLLSLSGVAFGFFVRAQGIMLLDEEWNALGQPERNPYSTALLIAYGGVTFILMAAALKVPLFKWRGGVARLRRKPVSEPRVKRVKSAPPVRPRAFVD